MNLNTIFKFVHPFTCMIAGPTSSGKTVFVRRLLERHELYVENNNNKVLKVLWMYGQWQNTYNETVTNVNVQYADGLVSETELESISPDIIVIDDLMNELGSDKSLANIFTRGSHHKNYSVIFIVQNIFHQGRYMRDISVNAHYFVLMKNPRDRSQILNLARQLYPQNVKFVTEAYEDATKKPFSYIKIDNTQRTPDEYRFQTCLFKEELADKIVKEFAFVYYTPDNVRNFTQNVYNPGGDITD